MFGYQQCKMESSLLQSFAGKDIFIFLEQSTKLTHIAAPNEFQTWIGRIYCCCKIPYDGKLMMKCPAWLHGICESKKFNNNFSDSQWSCSSCQFKKSSQKKAKRCCEKIRIF